MGLQPSPNPSGEGFFERKMREKRECTHCAVGCRSHPKRVGENWVEILIFFAGAFLDLDGLIRGAGILGLWAKVAAGRRAVVPRTSMDIKTCFFTFGLQSRWSRVRLFRP